MVALAICGAIVATTGAWLRHKGVAPMLSRVMYWGGYTCTGISIALFILAGLWGVEP